MQKTIVFEPIEVCTALYGEREAHLRLLEKHLHVQLYTQSNELRMDGKAEDVQRVEHILEQLSKTIAAGVPLALEDVRRAIVEFAEDQEVELSKIFSDTLMITHRGRRLTPKSVRQKLYVDGIRKHALTFGIGPAGTGKTYLAMAMAVAAFQRKEVEKIILTRPAVEAGERLGFLPGNLQDKVDPYLRPLYDALFDMVDAEKAEMMLTRGLVEVAPLAFMRGRTLNRAFIILDEAQNTSPEQMKMFLTRMGFDSKVVVTGDITQIDLPLQTQSGLVETLRILRDVEGVFFASFDQRDVVRHPLVQKIILAYERVKK
ncbi:MAG: PhoH family protein [Myxococcota bacterium]